MKQSMISAATRARHAGFTLVELMVAMTLGLVIVLVVAQVFLSSKESFNAVEQLSRLQENARYGMSQMARVIRSAGYITDPNTSRSTAFPALAPALAGTDGFSGATDEITVRFQGSGSPTADGTVIDCVGNEIVGGSLSVNRYYIGTGANNRSALFCANTGSDVPVVGAAVELVPNVESMQVIFGETTDADTSANYYVPWGNVATPDSVVAVRIALLFSSDDFVRSSVDTGTYTLLTTVVDPVNDRRLRRVYTTTITLRNRIQ
ncbi:MAG: prepilin-type N-terminal cleavage/methylation domain-containing protein [Betaproteobacteria bacterium]|nr:prepilin-type N-terminal cleavage/methylation domain-containing protein [Betaproteobacteria bacterium]